MIKTVLALSLFSCPCWTTEKHFNEEELESISLYLDYHGIDLQRPNTCDDLRLTRCLGESILFKKYNQLDPLATPEEWIGGVALITLGITLYAFPPTRSLGVGCIRAGFGIIGMASVNDFRDYAKKKGWLSDEDWNICNKALGDNS